MTSSRKRKVPVLTTDEAAEAFLAGDLSNLDFRQFRPTQFEFERKEAQVNLRLPHALLEAVKAQAKARGVPYARFIRESLERVLAGTATTHRPASKASVERSRPHVHGGKIAIYYDNSIIEIGNDSAKKFIGTTPGTFTNNHPQTGVTYAQ